MEQWWQRVERFRRARGWSQADAARHFIEHSPDHAEVQYEAVRTNIRRWEHGDVADPTDATKATIARMFGLPVQDVFPTRPLATEWVPARLPDAEFADLIARLRSNQVPAAHLEQARAEVERLCTAYASEDAAAVLHETDGWIAEMVNLRSRVDLDGHREVYRLTGQLALLRACLTYDRGDEPAAQQSRVAAMGFAQQLNDGVMTAWAHEISAWMALTQGDMPQVIAAANAGIQAAPHASVAAQLHAQKAKAYARMRDTHSAELELESVRQVLNSTPMPSNVRDHFTVDPTKASFYAMDTYRVAGADAMADAMADTVIATSTRTDGTVISPMRLAEAQLTKAVLLARNGDPGTALTVADNALTHQRRSAPSLLLVANEVAVDVSRSDKAAGEAFRQHVTAMSGQAS